MKDNFSDNSELYKLFRPNYPSELIDFILSKILTKDSVLDIGTGNGQLAKELSKSFNKVYAIDISASQIQNASLGSNIYYSVQAAESTNFRENQFDLITVAQAAHWFNFPTFYKEVCRILKQNGTFAVIGYGLVEVSKPIDVIVRKLYKDILGEYWDKERHYIDESYQTLPFPFEDKIYKIFSNTYFWSLAQFLGYLSTWSALKHYLKSNGESPMDSIHKELEEIWGNENREVNFPTFLVLATV